MQNFDERCCLPVKHALIIFLLLLHALVAGIAALHYVAHAYLIMTFFSFTLSTAVHRYHVYQYNREPDTEDQLYCENPEGSSKRSLDVLGVLRIGLKCLRKDIITQG